MGSEKVKMTSFSKNQVLPLVVNLDGQDTKYFDVLRTRSRFVALALRTNDQITQEIYDDTTAVMLNHYLHLDKQTLSRFKRLQLVVRLGAGFDNVDVPAATSLGIAVCTTPAVGVEEVADKACSFVLNLFTRTHQAALLMRDGYEAVGIDGIKQSAKGARRMRDKTLGLAGLGRIGMAVALRAKAFGLSVLYYDPYTPPGMYKSLGIYKGDSLAHIITLRLSAEADCLVLTMNLDAANRHCINAQSIATMKPGATIVNTSRGGLVDDVALAEALREGRLAGAALDVYEDEPHNPLKKGGVYSGVPNLMLTPHIGWYSAESNVETASTAAEEVLRLVANEPGTPVHYENCINASQLLSQSK